MELVFAENVLAGSKFLHTTWIKVTGHTGCENKGTERGSRSHLENRLVGCASLSKVKTLR